MLFGQHNGVYCLALFCSRALLCLFSSFLKLYVSVEISSIFVFDIVASVIPRLYSMCAVVCDFGPYVSNP